MRKRFVLFFVVIVFWWQVFAILQIVFEKKPWKNAGSQCEKTHMVPHFTESLSLCFHMNLLPLLHLVQIVWCKSFTWFQITMYVSKTLQLKQG
jgi:hypothetical protein